MIIQERAKIAAGYEVRNFNVLVQRLWGACKGRHETLRPETIRGYRAKFMIIGSVNGKRRSGRLITSRSAEKVGREQEMFVSNQQKSTHQGARESRLIRHTILSILHKELNYRPWNPHYVQEL